MSTVVNQIKSLPSLTCKPENLSPEQQNQLLESALALLAHKHKPGELLKNPQSTRQYLRLLLRDHTNEVFGCIYLDTKHTVIDSEHLFFGTIDGASIYPRVVAQKCLEKNAAAVIVYHNHPSGNCDPSQADQKITQRLKEALELLDIRVLDHIVVCAAETRSFAELGLL